MRQHITILTLSAMLATAIGSGACSIGTPPPPESPPVAPSPPTPPAECSTTQHAWNGFHLPLRHGAPGPFVVRIKNTSGYPFALAPLNRKGSPVLYTDTGAGFPMNVERVNKPDAEWLGIMTVRVDDADHMLFAEIQLNAPLLDRYGALGIARVAGQEAGHGAGLDHQRNVEDSAMDDCQGRPRTDFRRCLTNGAVGFNPHDFEQLDAIYAHAAEPGPVPCAGTGARTIVVHRFMVPD